MLSGWARALIAKSFLVCFRSKSIRKDTGYSTGSSHDDKGRGSKRKDKKKSRKDEDSPERPTKKLRKSRESSQEDEEKWVWEMLRKTFSKLETRKNVASDSLSLIKARESWLSNLDDCDITFKVQAST